MGAPKNNRNAVRPGKENPRVVMPFRIEKSALDKLIAYAEKHGISPSDALSAAVRKLR